VRFNTTLQIIAEDNVRTKIEIEAELDLVLRRMSQVIISQSDLDGQLSSLDRRRERLAKELNALPN
jgi:hypothetical protein